MGDMVAYYNGFFVQACLPVMTRQISLETIREAATESIYDVVVRTPLVRLELPGGTPGGPEIFLKLETLQPVGSFKIRGAHNAVQHLSPAQLAEGLWTVSAGNAAQGVALAARAGGRGLQRPGDGHGARDQAQVDPAARRHDRAGARTRSAGVRSNAPVRPDARPLRSSVR
jgi:hypothetical protein